MDVNSSGVEFDIRLTKDNVIVLSHDSIDIESKQEVLACKERSDVCAVQAASVVGEAMVALAITKAMIDKFGSDCMVDVLQNLQAYNERIKG